MPDIVRQGTGPYKEYGWLVLVGVLAVGFWLSAPRMSSTGSDSVAIDIQANEQSLHSLDPIDNPQGAPGEVFGADGKADGGAHDTRDASAQRSSLYASPGGAAGEPISEEKAEEMAQAKSGFAEAMARVAASGKAPDNGWGGDTARTGFSRPKAKFGEAGKTRGGGRGWTSAQYQLVTKAFGTGGDPGLNPGPGISGGVRGPRRSMRHVDGTGANNRSLSGLKKMNQVSLDALKGQDERAAGGGLRTFDAGASGSSAMSDLQSAKGAAGLSNDEGVPLNLKSNDPKQLNKREFEPPKVEAREVKKSDNPQYMQQQMMMMLLQTALTGIMGPMGSMIGGVMSSALQMQKPPANAQWGDQV